jgi:hypothetical protein
MEALVLATALRMIGTAVDDPDAELEQPYLEPRPALARRVSPRRAVVDEERIRQSIMAEGHLKPIAHRIAALIGTGLQAQIIARMIVNHRQGMALRIVAKPYPTLEVHLPQQVRRRHLEALTCHCAAQRGLDAIRPAQDLVHRRNRRRIHALALQAPRNLASSPSRMGVTYRNNLPLDRALCLPRAQTRTARLVSNLLTSLPTGQPFVPRLRMYTEPAAELSPVRPFLHRKSHKLPSLFHYRHLAPRHGWPPIRQIHALSNVSAMSPNTRR